MNLHTLLTPPSIRTARRACAAFGLSALCAAAVADVGDAQFLAAREAFRVGEPARVARALEALRGSAFEPWAEYYLLRMQLDDTASEAAIGDFLGRHAGSYLAEKLRGEWLKVLGLRGRWELFRREYPQLQQPDQEIVCYAWQDRQLMGDTAVLDEARPIWFTATDLPDACTPLTDTLVRDGRLKADDIWQRLRRLFEAGRLREMQAAGRYLNDPPATKIVEGIVDKPGRYLDRLPAHFAQTRGGRELALYALQRAAQKDPADAESRWRTLESDFDEADRAYIWGQLGYQGAKRHLPEALHWYALAGDSPLSDEQLAWYARAALRVQDWGELRRVIGRMPPRLTAAPDWIYWLGRADAALGRHEEALGSYRRIAGQTNFYGNLADDELGRPLSLPPRAAPASSEELAQAAENPALRRALALLRLDLRTEGVREWNWALRGMGDRQLLAAAEVARRNDVFDRAISAADRTQSEHDFHLRFPAPFRDEVEPRARQLALDDGWIYGLIRQESRFVMNAKSGAGAKGLMQVMPATARWVAKKIGLAGYHPAKMTDMGTNVTLGTHYLKMVLNGLDNQPVLACAAYNAGPGRAQRWRGDKPLEGAIYAETIPFAETRDYVKKVMSNSVYYNALFQDKPQSLKARLGVVQPRRVGDTTTDTLP
ncbi:MAG: lytic transglycosylase domain-containing protein [Rhodocyclaceae bacterium]|jgi:soluble lytic murein transglycosylase|nr:lytic transglycosylase domain-containing protein [Rhodocyclaceae bacterium]